MNRLHSRSRLKNAGATALPPFTPASLFDAGQVGVWFDPSDLTSLFQDDAGTVPVTAADQVVGMMRDKSGNGLHATQATEASKPILRNAGALWWLEFDGVDDFMQTASIPFSQTAMYTSCGVRKASDAAIGMVAELSVSSSANPGTFFIDAPGATSVASIAVRFNGTILRDRMSPPNYPAPISLVIGGIGNIAAGSIDVRVNGVVVSSDTPGLGTGTFNAYPLYIGRRGGTSLPFVGQVFGMVIRGGTVTPAEIAANESYLAGKSGVTL